MLLSELLNELYGSNLAEWQISMECASCGRNRTLTSIPVQVRSTLETLYECETGCGSLCILVALSEPRSKLSGTRYVMGNWIMQNTAEITVQWSLSHLQIFPPLFTPSGEPIKHDLVAELPDLIEKASKLGK